MPSGTAKASRKTSIIYSEVILAFIYALVPSLLYGLDLKTTKWVDIPLIISIVGAGIFLIRVFKKGDGEIKFFAGFAGLVIITVITPILSVPLNSPIIVNPTIIAQIDVAILIVASIVAIFAGYALFSELVVSIPLSEFIFTIFLDIALPIISLEILSYSGVSLALLFTNISIFELYLVFVITLIALKDKENKASKPS